MIILYKRERIFMIQAKKIITLVRKIPPHLLDRMLMKKSAQMLLSNFGHEINPERWIFIIGCYNSGTTVLASMLDRHPSIGGLRTEGAFLTDSLPYPELFGWPRMWSQCIEEVSVPPEISEERRAKRIKKHWSLWFPKQVPNLVEKTVSNAARMPFLQKFFQPAYFIYIVRNGYAVSAGIKQKANLKRWKNSLYKEYPIELCAEQWLRTDQIVQKDSKDLKNFLQISYEDLTENPHSTMNDITNFLGIEEFPVEVLKQEWIVHGEKSVISNMNNRSIRRLSGNDKTKIERVCGETLRKYGY